DLAPKHCPLHTAARHPNQILVPVKVFEQFLLRQIRLIDVAKCISHGLPSKIETGYSTKRTAPAPAAPVLALRTSLWRLGISTNPANRGHGTGAKTTAERQDGPGNSAHQAMYLGVHLRIC